MQQELNFNRVPYAGKRKKTLFPLDAGARTKNIAGLRCGMLVALEPVAQSKNGTVYWKARCDCGAETIVGGAEMRIGRATSCGCSWRKTFASSKICSRCKIEQPLTHFTVGNNRNYVYPQCRSCVSARNKARYALRSDVQKEKARARARMLRQEALKHYGQSCVCCGEAADRFLSIDHINGGGTRHRREVGSGDQFYNWLRRSGYPSGFQTLCHNCNFGRHLNGGVCPHKEMPT